MAVQSEQNGLVPLLYHELRDTPSAYSYVLPASRFAEHLQLFERLRCDAPPGLRPVITFDDGHISNHTHALPMLREAGRTAHFFITAGWTGRRAGFMGPGHLRDLHAAGHTVGAHGWSHALLTTCSDAELRRELGDAKSALEEWIGAPVRSMSLPGGRSDARVLRACHEAGYTTVWTSVPGSTPTAHEPTIGRYNILSSLADEPLGRLLEPASAALQRAHRIGTLKAAVQRALGDRMYARLWALINRQEAEPDRAPGTAEDAAP